MNVEQLLEAMRKDPACGVLSPQGLPTVSAGHVLPPDLKAFYTRCGGVELFSQAKYGVRLMRPGELVLANPVIIGEPAEYDITGT